MAYLEPKLVAKLAQKQVLTPGLVQMVSLLTLNKLELTPDMCTDKREHQPSVDAVVFENALRQHRSIGSTASDHPVNADYTAFFHSAT